MLTFNEYVYERPDWPALKAELEALNKEMKDAKSAEEFIELFEKFDALQAHFASESSLMEIRHTVDTRDEFYSAENEFFNETTPLMSKEMDEIYETILESPYRKELEEKIGSTWFTKAEFAKKAFDPRLVEDMQEENRLQAAYQNLVASAQIPFEGKIYTLAALDAQMNSSDRATREKAFKAYWGWYEENEKAIGEIFDKMVKVRTRMAKTLGYDTFHPLGYLRMNRLDYDQKDVEVYRKNVLSDVVPVCQNLYDRQIKRLGFSDTLNVWDEKVEFLDGNAKPVGTTEEQVDVTLEMFKELDGETGEFFQFMKDHQLLDLDAKTGKAAGGYCTFLPDYASPFIFCNFNHTQGDIETLTHESGHAFQAYSSRNIKPVDSIFPTMESAEIHSMSMEFFTWPWMEKFFKDDVDKYYFAHLSGSVKFIPYGVLVDHFQHEVYDHPEWSHEERMACWRRLEKEYLPHKDYTGIDVLERGGWWMRQLHIFMHPFYYIDYTLAQVCALQFWKRIQDQDPEAFEDYKKICKAGGTLPFKSLVSLANLKVPFEDGCLKDTMAAADDWFAHQSV